MKRTFTLVAALLFSLSPASGAEEVGRVTFLEGFPELTRDGEVLYDTLDYGYPVENFDGFQTDSESYLEIELHGAVGADAIIKVAPETSFFLDVSTVRSEGSATVELLSGSVSVAARELAGLRQLNVRSLGVAAGVRGTTFDVSIALGGEVLVSAEEGLVEVTDTSGASLFAAPGEAVEVNEYKGVARNIRYEGEAPGAFREQWLEDRNAAFRENPELVIRLVGSRYRDARSRFLSAYSALMRRRAIIDRWIEESRRGRPGDQESFRRDRETMAEDLARIREVMVEFHHTLVRLDRMFAVVRERYAGTGSGRSGERLEIVSLLRLIDEDRVVMRQRLATSRQILKLAAERNSRWPSEASEPVE